MFSAELLPKCFLFDTHPKPTSNSHCYFSVMNCRNPNPDPSPNPNPNCSRISKIEVPNNSTPSRLQYYNYEETLLTTVFNRFLKAGQNDAALHIIESEVGKGHKPNRFFCTKLIKGFFNSGRVDKVVEVITILESHGEADVVAYSAMISGFCWLDRIEDAERVLNVMKKKGVPPDAFSYTILIEAYCARRKLELAIKMFKKLLEDNCEPSVVTYTVLIWATLFEYGLTEAMNLFVEMLSAGFRPDTRGYDVILEGMIREGMLDYAFEYIRYFEPDVRSYMRLLRGVLVQGKWSYVERLVQEMLSRNCEPNCYDILIKYLCQNVKVDEAMSFLRIMNGNDILPVVQTYNNLILGLSKAGRVDDAIGLLEEMVETGCKPNEETYATLIRGIGYYGMVDDALNLATSLFLMTMISKESFVYLMKTFRLPE